MKASRRTLLRVGGAALAAGLAGCGELGPRPEAAFDVAVADAFGTDPPVEVPLTATVEVQNVGSEEMAARGVAVALFGPGGGELAVEPLGAFTYRDASADERTVGTPDGDDRVYRTVQEAPATVTVDVVPERVGFRVDELWYGRDEPESANALAARRPLSPSAPVEASGLAYDGQRPPPSTADERAFRRLHARYWPEEVNEGAGTLLLPEPATPTPSPAPTERAGGTRTAANGTARNGTATGATPDDRTTVAGDDPGTATTTGTRTSEAGD